MLRPSEPPPVSEPPPSLEGHTLIGGWREPGLGPQGPGIPLGVRVPAPVGFPSPVSAAPQTIGTGPSQPSVGASPGASAGEVVGPKPARSAAAAPPPVVATAPAVTRAELPAAGQVARFEGAAPTFAPTTFGELLDATLGL